MSNLNSLDYWKAALAGDLSAFNSNVPARGWYRARRKGEEYKPCAYWYDDNGGLKWVGLREFVDKSKWTERDPVTGELDIDEDNARRLWLFIHKNPISYRTYEKVDAGEPWLDIDPVVSAHQLVNSNQPIVDPAEEFKKKIEEAGVSSDKYIEITSDEQAVQAQTLRAHLLKLHKDSEENRKELKKPFQNEADLVDSKWMPVTKLAKTFADKIRSAIAAWETKKLQAKKPPAPDDVSEKPPQIPAIKGASGRAASVKPRRVAVAITNLDALMHSLKGRPELEPLLLGLAQKILDENGDVLGVSIDTVAEVR